MREMISVVCIQVKKIVLVSETKMVQMRRFRRDFSWPIFLNYMPIVMQISKFENWTYCFCSPAAKMMHICWCCWIAQCVCNQHINTSLNYGDVLKFCLQLRLYDASLLLVTWADSGSRFFKGTIALELHDSLLNYIQAMVYTDRSNLEKHLGDKKHC